MSQKTAPQSLPNPDTLLQSIEQPPPAADAMITYKGVWATATRGERDFYKIISSVPGHPSNGVAVIITIPSITLALEVHCTAVFRCGELSVHFTCRFNRIRNSFSDFLPASDANGLKVYTKTRDAKVPEVWLSAKKKKHGSTEVLERHGRFSNEVWDENGNQFLFAVTLYGLDEKGKRIGGWFYLKRVLEGQALEDCWLTEGERAEMPWIRLGSLGKEEPLTGCISPGDENVLRMRALGSGGHKIVTAVALPH